MDITKDTYKKYLNDICENMTKSPLVSKNTKKILGQLIKKTNKLDDETFSFLSEIHLNYILNVIMNGESNNPFINILQSLNEEDDSKDELTENNHRDDTRLQVINDDDTRKPIYTNDVKWVMRAPMELTITSNGMIFMNHELWDYLVDILYHEAFINMPLIFARPDQPDKITINLGYDNNKLFICLNKGASRYMKITFHKKKDKRGKTYGMVDEETSFSFGINSSFNIQGRYTFKPTNMFSVLYGEKIK